MLERVLEQLAEDERERGRLVAGKRHRLERGLGALFRPEPLNEHRAQPVKQFVEVDVVVAALGQHLVDGCDREDPVRGVVERLARIDLLARPRLEP